MKAKTINEFRGKYFFLSNFYKCEFVLDRVVWRSVEHFYQAQKTIDLTQQLAIINAPTAEEAKQLGQTTILRSDWNLVKDSVMFLGVSAKFSIPKLRERLLATGDSTLIEGNDWGDTYWGVTEAGGKNKLGILLMEIREKLNKSL